MQEMKLSKLWSEKCFLCSDEITGEESDLKEIVNSNADLDFVLPKDRRYHNEVCCGIYNFSNLLRKIRNIIIITLGVDHPQH